MTSAIDPLLIIASANPLAHLLSGHNIWAITFGVLLLAISLFVWSVIASKALALRSSGKNDKIFLQHFRDSAHPLEVYGANAKPRGSVLHEVYNCGAQELTYHWLGSSEVDDTFEARLQRASAMSQRESSLFRTRLRRIAEEARQGLGSRMLCLSCLVNSVPLLGLLATAWGLMAAFGASQTGEIGTSIASLQPNIGTTLSLSVLSLLVAIPAGIGTHLLRDQVQRKSHEVRLFCAELDASIVSAYPSATTSTPSSDIEAKSAEAEPSAASSPASPIAPSAAIPPLCPKERDLSCDTDHGIAIVTATAVAKPSVADTIKAAVRGQATAKTTTEGEQLTFDSAAEEEEESSNSDVEPSINPIARQTALQAPDLLFETPG